MPIGQKRLGQKCQMLMPERLRMADKSSRVRRQIHAVVVIQRALRLALETLQNHN